MIVCFVLYLPSLLLAALAQTIPDADLAAFVPDSEGDLIFLLDSSGSVSYYEFAKVKEFIGNLLRPFTFGPQDVQASIVHISTEPALEFSFNQYGSRQEIQKAIQNTEQRMGDTNTGKALFYIKDNLFEEKRGSRADVPKVMVWVTDGLSTDDVSLPMQLLKDMGVTVFIVSTGRGNYLNLSAAASQPTDNHLHFVDVDDLHIITRELRNAIIEIIRTRRLHAQDITATSFQIIWPNLLSRDTGHYLLEYGLVSNPDRKLRKTLSGDETSAELHDLTPDTTYQVTLFPESNVHYIQSQTIQVSTLPEIIWTRRLHAENITATSFQLIWPKLLYRDTGHYVLEYGLVSYPESKLRKILSGDETSTELQDLTPGTTYQGPLKAKLSIYNNNVF
ncbi:hypothetical protein GDO86_012657 [Hymenochirus boettgeri]|uniref:von Willebrand factor A domain-containing protein 1 n=1 Tax=Hymenochirus boettgeri TaxID=247094 RepID=A0A8T2IN58_9PIPI|nr:hypothetical protein GDO86_012657 [Hymenochirus boettgeri]